MILQEYKEYMYLLQYKLYGVSKLLRFTVISKLDVFKYKML